MVQIPENAERKQRVIGGKLADQTEVRFEVMVPQVYAAGYVVDEAHASILNQTLAENISNNLRAKLLRGFEVSAPADGKEGTYRPYTPEEAQALVDEYVAAYSPGVRSGGGGGAARVTDPVEREALNIAGEQVESFLKDRGVKKADVDFKTMRAKLFDSNRDAFMKEGKRVVDARNKAIGNSDSLTADLLQFMPGIGGGETQPATEAAGE